MTRKGKATIPEKALFERVEKEADKIIKQRADDTDGECCCEIVETSRIKVIKED